MIPYAYILVIAIPLFGAALMPLAGLIGKNARLVLAGLAGLATAVCSVALYGFLTTGTVYSFTWAPKILQFSVGTDALSVFMAMIAGVLGFLIIIYSFKYMELDTDQGFTRYYALVLLFIGGMIGLVLTTNLLILYFFWELVGLCSYALIGFYYRNPKAAAAGIKAFITTRIGDVGLFTGIMLLYFGAEPHTFDIPALIQAVAKGAFSPHVLALAGFAMLVGAVGKSAQAPLHVWLPDAMEAPTPISALIHAATMVNAGVYLMTRVYPMFHGVPHWSQTVMWVGVVTAFLAGLAAVVEFDLKRLLAYSTVSQLGYMMFAVGMGGLVAAQFHLLSHAIFKAALFLCAGSAIHAAGSRDMRDMGGLGKTMKFTAASFFIGVCALSGIPIFNGFWSKDMIFASALESGNIVPLIIAVLTAAMTVAYSFKAYATVFLGEPKKKVHDAHGHEGEAPFGMVAPVVTLAFGAIVSSALIGIFTKAYVATGLAERPIGVWELYHETFTSPAVLGSLAALVLGFAAFFLRDSVAGFARRNCAPVIRFIRSGFGFDALYNWIIDKVVVAGRALFNGYDEQVADGFDCLLVSGFRGFSSVLRKSHTGDLAFEVLGIMVGLLVIIAVIFLV